MMCSCVVIIEKCCAAERERRPTYGVWLWLHFQMILVQVYTKMDAIQNLFQQRRRPSNRSGNDRPSDRRDEQEKTLSLHCSLFLATTQSAKVGRKDFLWGEEQGQHRVGYRESGDRDRQLGFWWRRKGRREEAGEEMQGQGRSRMGGRGGGYQYRQGQQPYNVAGWQVYQPAYVQQQVQPLVPVYGRSGASSRGLLPLGVQAAGILKRPTGAPQGPLMSGRGHARGRGRGWGGRGVGARGRGRGRDKERDQKPLTKEALDADLDEWRMKDKKLGGQSLDADLDDYWKKKENDSTKQEDDDEELIETAPVSESVEATKVDAQKAVKSGSKKSSGARIIDRNTDKAVDLRTDISAKVGEVKV